MYQTKISHQHLSILISVEGPFPCSTPQGRIGGQGDTDDNPGGSFFPLLSFFPSFFLSHVVGWAEREYII